MPSCHHRHLDMGATEWLLEVMASAVRSRRQLASRMRRRLGDSCDNKWSGESLRFGGEKTLGRSRDGKLLNLQNYLASIRVLGPGNIFCASLRGTAAPCLRLLAGELQASAVSGGGTQFANFCARLFQRLAASYGLSRSALVADLRKACYAAMLEFGPTITSCNMRQFFVTQGLCRLRGPVIQCDECIDSLWWSPERTIFFFA